MHDRGKPWRAQQHAVPPVEGCVHEARAHALCAGGKHRYGSSAGGKAGARKKPTVRDRLMKKLRLK